MIRKEFGTYYYKKYVDDDLEGVPIYEIYDENKKWLANVGAFSQVREYCMASDKDEYLRVYG